MRSEKNEDISGYIGYQLFITAECIGKDGRNQKVLARLKKGIKIPSETERDV